MFTVQGKLFVLKNWAVSGISGISLYLFLTKYGIIFWVSAKIKINSTHPKTTGEINHNESLWFGKEQWIKENTAYNNLQKKKGKSYEGIRPPPANSLCVIANKWLDKVLDLFRIGGILPFHCSAKHKTCQDPREL